MAIHYNNSDLVHYNAYVDILKHLGGSEPTSDEVWEIARKSEQEPVFENILYHLVFSAIEHEVEQLDRFELLDLTHCINARATYLCIDGESIESLDDFKQATDEEA